MADPISIASGIAGLISLAGSVVSTCYQYGCAVKSAPTEIQKLLGEVMSLSGVLTAVKSLIDAETAKVYTDEKTDCRSDYPPPYRFVELEGPLNDCRCALEEIEAVLKKASSKEEHKLGKAFKRLIWPLKQPETMAIVARLERSKSAFMLTLTVTNVSVGIEVQGLVHDIHTVIEVDRWERHSMKQESHMRHVYRWLSPFDPASAHRAARRLQLAGTGSWVLNHPTWHSWIDAESAFLWLYGIPGSGKTVLMSTLLENCFAHAIEKNAFLVYFYCDFRENESQKSLNLLGSLICQLCSQFKESPQELNDFVDTHRTGGGQFMTPEFEDLESLFLKLLARCPPTVIAIDALDECVERDGILSLLKEISSSTSSSGKVKILLSSRQEGDIVEAVAEHAHHSIRVHAENNDVDSYVFNFIAKNSRLRRLPQELKDKITTSLNSGAHGMFRWVQCQIEELSRLRTDRDIRQALTRLPSDLTETYLRVLNKIQDSDRPVAARALKWLVYAPRPLRLTEIAEAAIIDNDTTVLDPESRWYPSDLLHVIGSLALYSSEDNIIALAHHSVKDFLESKYVETKAPEFYLNPETGSLDLAATCLTYLLMKDFSLGATRSYAIYKRRVEDFPLLEYAARFWPFHAQERLHNSPLVVRLSLHLMHPSRTPNFWAWSEAMISQGYFSFRKESRVYQQSVQRPRQLRFKTAPTHLTPLYYAASFGLWPVVKGLLDQNVDVNEQGGMYGGTALHAAVFRHHYEVVRLLLEYGARTNIKDGNDMTALNMNIQFGGGVRSIRDGNSSMPSHQRRFGREDPMRKLLMEAAVKARDVSLASSKAGEDHIRTHSGL